MIEVDSWSAWLKKDRHGFAIAVFLLALLAFFVGHSGKLDAGQSWWFEDDTPHLAFVREHTNPFAYFADPELVHKLSLGHSVTPWFPFTFWLDQQISPLSPTVAYAHTLFSMLLAGALLILFLHRHLGVNKAFLVAAAWFWLPAVITISEFLSTRHYLEGLCLLLISLIFQDRILQRKGNEPGYKRHLLGAFVFYLLACTTKEVYVSAGFWLLLTRFVYARRWSGVIGTLICGVLYTIYRFWSLGLAGKNVDLSILERYHLFLGRLPFMFTGSYLGYAVLLAALVFFVLRLKRKQVEPAKTLFWLGLFGVLLLTILPVTAPVTDQYMETGTWYRVVFLLVTALLVGFAFLVDKGPLGEAALVLVGIAAFFGGMSALEKWGPRKAAYTADAHFYIENPDLFLFSPLPAPWFMYGVHRLYEPNREKHYVTWRVDNGTQREYVARVLTEHDTLWRRLEEGEALPDSGFLEIKRFVYVEDKEILQIMRQNFKNGVTPLDQKIKIDP